MNGELIGASFVLGVLIMLGCIAIDRGIRAAGRQVADAIRGDPDWGIKQRAQ